jgi:hypothetical protein
VVCAGYGSWGLVLTGSCTSFSPVFKTPEGNLKLLLRLLIIANPGTLARPAIASS